MRRTRVFGALCGALVIASTVAAPHAAADPCRWIAHDLPLPANSDWARTSGSSENNRFIVGEAEVGSDVGQTGLLWDNGVLTRLPSAGSSMIGVRPVDVNNDGVVVGRQQFYGQQRTLAFRYSGGAFELLETPEGYSSRAEGINNLGDVVGEVWHEDDPEVRDVVVWPRIGSMTRTSSYIAVGISDDGKYTHLSHTSAFVNDLATGQQVELPGGKRPMVLDNDRVFYPTATGIEERDLAGQQVATWVGGTLPWGRTSSGHVVFGAVNRVATLWQWGIRYPVDSAKQPVVTSTYYGDVTDEGALIGVYHDDRGRSHPARWFWCG
ncbi:hypothetical protein [Lentzea sp. E54]|uniref:hypothetical protein n=1 Tax=Lentzea xerophila TaxID=3435883 RepID=UPI003DA2D28A